MEFDVFLTEGVLDRLAMESPSVEDKAMNAASLLSSTPEIGRAYQAENGDDESPIPCRCYPLPGTTKTLYYCVNHSEKRVTVFAMVDQRRNPAYRFAKAKQGLRSAASALPEP